MRSIRNIILVGFLGLMSCGNEIDLTIWAETVPVVYGIICPKDSIHEVSLRRSFICEENIPQYAAIPDSNYYPDARIFLETRAPTGEIIQRAEMFKHELSPREPGMFVSSPNFIYRCITQDLIIPGYEVNELRYALTIDIPEHKQAIISESIIPPLPEISEPKPGDRPYKLDLFSFRPQRFVWRGSLDFYIEFETRVNYLEQRNGEWSKAQINHHRKYNHWDKLVIRPDEVYIDSDWFYPMIGARIKDEPEVSARKFISIDFILKTSDADFYDYFSYEHYQTDLSTNIYTNIVNGLGLFVAYNKTEWKGYTLNERSMDQLSFGKYTKHLNFVRWD